MSTVDGSRPRALAALRRWVAQRGVLFALLQTPMLALFGGFLLRYTTLPVATLVVFVSFLLLPVWVSYCRSTSRDPADPIHHVHRYLLWSLLPYVTFSIARIPAYYLFGINYWGMWHGFGSQLTAEPPATLLALLAGMAMYTIQGIALNTSFYVLFRRHSLLNALLFIFVFFSALFSFAFPVYSLAGARPNFAWYVVHWGAHLAMALVAWLMPALWQHGFPRLRKPGRIVLIGGAAALLMLPYAFAIERAVRWQFDAQTRLEHAAMQRIGVNADSHLTGLAWGGDQSRYTFVLQVGPRTYRNVNGVMRAVDVGPVDVTGRITHAGVTIAWCFGHSAGLPSPNKIRDPIDFVTVAAQTDIAALLVTCHGPASEPSWTKNPTLVEWTARAKLSAERSKQIREFTGQQPVTLAVPHS